MSKCICGYECRLPGEQEMLDQYGCARTSVRREQPFNNLSLTTCSRDNLPPEAEPIDNGQSFADQFKEKYQPKPKDNGNSKTNS